MTAIRPAPATTFRDARSLQVLRRWARALVGGTPRTRRPRPHTTLAHPPAPPLSLWELDRTELATALEHGRW